MLLLTKLRSWNKLLVWTLALPWVLWVYSRVVDYPQDSTSSICKCDILVILLPLMLWISCILDQNLRTFKERECFASLLRKPFPPVPGFSSIGHRCCPRCKASDNTTTIQVILNCVCIRCERVNQKSQHKANSINLFWCAFQRSLLSRKCMSPPGDFPCPSEMCQGALSQFHQVCLLKGNYKGV